MPKTQDLAYAQDRANDTRRPYLITGMGHVFVDCGPNRRLADECGGVAMVVKPSPVNQEISYMLAHAAANDAANRSMRAAGRTKWSEEDYNVAVRTLNQLLPEEETQNA